MATPTQLAWAAGIFDGEGTFTLLHNRQSSHSLRAIASLTMTCEETVKKFSSILLLGLMRLPTPATDKHSAKYHWQANGSDCVSVCKYLRPYLFTKLPQAELLIEYSAVCMGKGWSKIDEDQRQLRSDFLAKIRAFNKRGV